MRDDIYGNMLTDDFHHTEVVGGDRQHDYTVFVFVCLLHFGKVGLDFLKHLHRRFG